MMARNSAFAALYTSALALASFSASAQTCSPPKPMAFHIQSEFRRDSIGFTEGLTAYGSRLFESTGPIGGETRLTVINYSGHVTTLARFGHVFFGEGLTIWQDHIYQLSWKEHLAFVYDLTGRLIRQMRNPLNGWGLTNDGKDLIFTDGGDRLYFVDPETFKPLRSVQVRLGTRPISGVNELEYADGNIYANVFKSWSIVRIEPRTGCIEGLAKLRNLQSRMDSQERAYISSDPNFVLNGIAFDPQRKLFYITGKNWTTIFVGRFSNEP